MTYRRIIHSIFMSGLLLCSCQKQPVDVIDDISDKGRFSISVQEAYSISITKGADAHLSSYGNMHAEWNESAWTKSDLLQTRGNVTGDEYVWPDSTTVSLYLTDTDNDVIVSGDNAGLGDIPLNPKTYKAYTKYRPYKEAQGTTEILDEQLVSSSTFFWTEKKTGIPDAMPDEVNFYGYYPRPFDGDANSLLYEKTSIIQKEKAHDPYSSDWNMLPYTFSDLQTDENLSYHDVMCSIPEYGGLDCNYRYGNQAKTKDSSVQLHFKHMFSLLKIEIDKGESYDKDGQKPCIVSDLTLSGSEVYTQGTLNILTGETTCELTSRSSIKRDLPADLSIKAKAMQTTMLVQPISSPDSGLSEEEMEGRFRISCKIDGIPFSCSIPDIALEAGKKYDIRLTLDPNGGFVFRIWNGANVTVGNNERTYSNAGEYNEVRFDSDKFTVKADAGSQVVGVLCNGSPVQESSGSYSLLKGLDTPVYYDVIAVPESWYSEPESMRIHFDAIWNNKYNSSSTVGTDWSSYNVWSDLSGHDNNGSLKSFNGTSESGWSDNGLNFDGDDDIVTYPGNINAKEYTMELYIHVPDYSQKPFARITAEGGNPNGYPCYYFPGGKSREIELYAHGTQWTICRESSDYFNASSIVQLDFVFKYDEKKVSVYCNGNNILEHIPANCTVALSVPIASLGNRIQDNTRALRATFYSFILYDKALLPEQIAANYAMNVSRYGKTI